MNLKSLIFSVVLLSTISLCSCKKKKEDLPPGYLKGMFIAGIEFSGTKAYLRYWKDSVQQTIETSEIEVESESEMYKLAVTGNDVYILGVKRNTTTNIVEPYFWKNGAGSLAPVEAFDIAASGTDVWLGGRRSVPGDNGPRACISKNGVVTDLTNGSGYDAVMSVYLSGSDVYGAGFYRPNNVYEGVYWKNGTPNPVANARYLYSIYVSGNDVYTCGINTSNKAAWWKNGTMTELPGVNAGSYARAILVSGTDVHVVGNDKINNSYVATHWKNDVSQNIASITNGGSVATSLALDGTDSYITGFQQTALGKQAVYWKNGNMRLLSPAAKGFATAIKIIR